MVGSEGSRERVRGPASSPVKEIISGPRYAELRWESGRLSAGAGPGLCRAPRLRSLVTFVSFVAAFGSAFFSSVAFSPLRGLQGARSARKVNLCEMLPVRSAWLGLGGLQPASMGTHRSGAF